MNTEFNMRQEIVDDIRQLAEEVIRTLIMFDVVNLDGVVQAELRESIEREGKIIYEKGCTIEREG